MLTVHELSAMAGVSIRTLHHYDEIGLLKPAALSPAGYRLYDENAVRRLHSILILRELEFPLRDIRDMLDSADINMHSALAQQIRLLRIKQERLEKIIRQAERMQKDGWEALDMSVFDKSEFEQQQAEAKAKWGGTQAWAEYVKKPKANAAEAGTQLMAILADIGSLRNLSAESEAVQQKIAALQQHITANFYTCTNEILLSLGQMYVSDDRFRINIDKAGGEGTAAFVKAAIEIYCS